MTQPMQRRLTAIMAADVVGYSRLMEQDEAATLAQLQANRRDVILPQVAAHGGRIVKLMGDGSLIEFPSIVAAVACAVEVQSLMSASPDIPAERRIRYRIGINLGDVMVEGDDIYGDGVNVAARLQELAAPGGIAVSGSVKDHIAGKLPLELDDQGDHALKNIDRPVRVFTVRGDGLASTAVPIAAAAPRRALEQRRSLCVLPFTNMSGDIEQEYFSDGITEDIITDLSRLSALAVVARNTAFAFKGKSVRVEQVARDLKVGFVLEGSVRKAGNRVRITAQLTDIASNFHVWAERFDRTLDDVFAIQDEISRSIVDALKLELLPSEREAIAAKSTPNPEAYEIYLVGRSLFYDGQLVETLKTAKRLFEKAHHADPTYARAYAAHALCDCYLLFLSDQAGSPAQIMEHARRALELEPGLADAHAAMGQAYHSRGRKRDAEVEFENALLLDDGLFEAHYLYARHCYTWGEAAKAIDHYRRAAELRPDDYRSASQAASAYIGLGHADQADPWLKEGLRRIERAIKARPENVDPLAYGAVVLVQMGELDRATAWARRAALINDGNVLISYNLGCFYSLMGKFDEAMDSLEQIASGTPLVMSQWMKHDIDLDPLRDLPRFKALVARMEAEADLKAKAMGEASGTQGA